MLSNDRAPGEKSLEADKALLPQCAPGGLRAPLLMGFLLGAAMLLIASIALVARHAIRIAREHFRFSTVQIHDVSITIVPGPGLLPILAAILCACMAGGAVLLWVGIAYVRRLQRSQSASASAGRTGDQR